jgi:ER membrane protein complex subunit 1
MLHILSSRGQSVLVDYMRHFYLLGLILANISPALAALHKSDVGIVDWHQPYVGVPLTSLSTAPTFHNKLGRAPIVLTATRSNVLAALHASNGSLGIC